MSTNGTRVVDVMAGVSVPSWLLSIVVDTLPIVQWIAGAVAIVAGSLAIYRHFRRD